METEKTIKHSFIGGINHETVIPAGRVTGKRIPGKRYRHRKTPDGTRAVTAYLHHGTQREQPQPCFVEDGEGIRTQAFDPGKLSDPSLIIYAPVRVLGNKTIVTNGDQTDTIYEGMDKQLTFEQSLRSREFEPDAPNYTPGSPVSFILKTDVTITQCPS